jgi:hypothetical protein
MVMRSSNWTPSIVPTDGQGYCLVIDDLGYFGQVFREADVEATNFETVVMDLLEGQYSNPVRVVSFNTGEGGRAISRPMLQPRCGNGVISSAMNPRMVFKTFWSGTNLV